MHCQDMQIALPALLTLECCQRKGCRVKLEVSPCKQTICESNAIAQINSHIPDIAQEFYPPEFVKLFLFIKLNSLSKPVCSISVQNQGLLQKLCDIYNEDPLDDVRLSNNEDEVIAQIICKIRPEELKISGQQFEEMSAGCALITTTAIWLLKEANEYFEKQQVVFCMSFVALGGRNTAFTPIVHEQKNHAGQLAFAKAVHEMTCKNEDPALNRVQEKKVQDPYSIRCSPHVTGIVYDLLSQLQSKLGELINFPHHKHICIGGRQLPNLLRRSDCLALTLDYLLCSMQEMGAMSFLRSERILNSYLGSNNIQMQRSEQYESLKVMLNKGITLASENKLLSEMSNADTMNLNNYESDIFANPGCYFPRLQKMISNLYYLMALQGLSSLVALTSLYPDSHRKLYKHQKVQESLNFFCDNVDVRQRRKAVIQIRNSWKISEECV